MFELMMPFPKRNERNWPYENSLVHSFHLIPLKHKLSNLSSITVC